MEYLRNEDGKPILEIMVRAIQKNKDLLSEVDGLIGDGDHGANMNKGFSMFGERIANAAPSLTDGLQMLGELLFTEIGGSMGPIYGTLFIDMAQAGADCKKIGLQELTAMLAAGVNGLCGILDARQGDKTLMDALIPAQQALAQAAKEQADFSSALERMKQSADDGALATINMVAKFGRSSRLGERSRGVPDAGATSCRILLEALADGILEQIQ